MCIKEVYNYQCYPFPSAPECVQYMYHGSMLVTWTDSGRPSLAHAEMVLDMM